MHTLHRKNAPKVVLSPFKRAISAFLLSSAALPIASWAQIAPSTASALDDSARDDAVVASPEDGSGTEVEEAVDSLVEETSGPRVDETSAQPIEEESDAQSEEESDSPVVEASGPQIEEIVVTAQKRQQVSQDVPISMSVVTETFIKDQGITDIADALLFVPNFKIKEFGNFATPQCRGFSIDEANPAFEPPCGLALDGVAYTRGSYFASGLFDVKRMEVLRGPQGTTFGKNTTAGVVGLYSKDPTDEYTANADVQYGVHGPLQRRLEAAAGGPLIPGVVNFRVAGMRELREGYAENTYHQVDRSVREDAGGRDRSTYRLKLTFPNVLGSEIKLLTERSDLTSLGLPVKIYASDDSAAARFARLYDPNADFGENNKVSNPGGENRTVITRHQAEWNKNLGGWGLTLVGATGKLNADSVTVGSTPAPLLNSTRDEESPFSSVELRAVSPNFDGLFGLDVGGSSNLLVGIFKQRQEIERLRRNTELSYVGLFGQSLLSLADSGGLAPFGFPAGSITTSQDLEIALATLRPFFFPFLPAGATGESFTMDFGQKTDTLAVFSQFTWNATDKWTVDLGSRVSIETKTAHWNLDYSTPSVLDPAGDKGFEAERTLGNSNFQPKISLGYKLTDDINLFSHWARAFKSGGFNAFLVQGNPETAEERGLARNGSLSFADESATEWGLDAKMRLLDNRMRLNVSLFRLDVDDFQVLTNVPGTPTPTEADPNARAQNGYQEVANAGKARAQGVEVDLMYLPTSWLTVIGSVGYNDTEYLSFKNDNCEVPVETPDQTGKCDHSGKPFKNVPKWGNTLGLDMRFPLGGAWSALGDLELLLGGTVEYTGSSVLKYNPGPGEDGETDAAYRYRAHIGVSAPGQGWSFRITGLNLSDEDDVAKTADNGVFSGAVPVPRSAFAQFIWTY